MRGISQLRRNGLSVPMAAFRNEEVCWHGLHHPISGYWPGLRSTPAMQGSNLLKRDRDFLVISGDRKDHLDDGPGRNREKVRDEAQIDTELSSQHRQKNEQSYQDCQSVRLQPGNGHSERMRQDPDQNPSAVKRR